MRNRIRADYEQIMMFPPCLEDWVPKDHPARFIRDTVDAMDLRTLGFRTNDSDVGGSCYGPDLLLKVWLYGYFNKIRSTRNLERACREHMGLIWLSGRNYPDHNTLWRFFHKNKKGIESVFKNSVRVALTCGLVGMVENSVDGTKIMSNAAREELMSLEDAEIRLEQYDRRIEDYMTEIERQAQEGVGEYKLPFSMQCALQRRQNIRNALAVIQESGQKKVHHREPEARLMKNRRVTDLAYNAQAVADKDNGIIVAAEVVTDESDNGQSVLMLDRVKENVGRVADVNSLDGGYFSGVQIGLAEERGYNVLINRHPSEIQASDASKPKVYHVSLFTYDKDRNSLTCPQGVELHYAGTKVKGANAHEFHVFRCRSHKTCPHRSKCTNGKAGREVAVSVHYEAIERHRIKREDPKNKELLRHRKAIIEPVFAWIKSRLGFRRWTVYGLEAVRAQWFMICATINLQKLYKHWLSGGLAPIME